MTEKHCKKCNRVLPQKYKGKLCEHCKSENANKIGKKVTLFASLAAVAGTAVGIFKKLR